jgi:hypothetical protein
MELYLRQGGSGGPGVGIHNTLDQAYDEGGAGAGRAITGDAGAVTITVPDTSSNAGLEITQNDVTNNPDGMTVTNVGTGNGISATSTVTSGSDVVTVNASATNAGAGRAISIQANAATVYTPKANQALLTAGTIVAKDARFIQVSGSGGAVTLTSTPHIADGLDGQEIVLFGTSDVDTLTLQDEGNLAGSNLQLSAGVDFTLGIGDSITLVFLTSVGDWVEISRSGN